MPSIHDKVPTCQNCGKQSWLRIQEKVEPYEHFIMCFGCCKVIKEDEAVYDTVEVHGNSE